MADESDNNKVAEFPARVNSTRQNDLFVAFDSVLDREEFASGQITNLEILGALEMLKFKMFRESLGE